MNLLKTKELGNTGMQITRIGFGSWAVGGEWAFGWGPQDDSESIKAIRRALELGVNWIDTAAVYGLGHSEEVVAKALQGVSRKPYIFTKCSQVWDDKGNVTTILEPASVRRECEASLRRLKVDAIDLYQIHWPQDELIEQGWETLATLKEEGKVRHIGVSNFSVAQLKRIMPIAPVSSLQPQYSMIYRNLEADVLPFCLEHHIGVIAYSPMGAGVLTGTMTRERFENLPAGDWRRKSRLYQEPLLTRHLRIGEQLRDMAKRLGHPAGEIAIAWVLNNPAVTGAIVGGRSAAQVDGIIGGADLQLSAADLREIEDMLKE